MMAHVNAVAIVWQLSGGNSPAFALIIVVMLLVPLILLTFPIPLILSLILPIPAILLNFLEAAFVVLVIATVIVVTGIIVAVIGSTSTVIWPVSVGFGLNDAFELHAVLRLFLAAKFDSLVR
jgi:hypothetical protein